MILMYAGYEDEIVALLRSMPSSPSREKNDATLHIPPAVS